MNKKNFIVAILLASTFGIINSAANNEDKLTVEIVYLKLSAYYETLSTLSPAPHRTVEIKKENAFENLQQLCKEEFSVETPVFYNSVDGETITDSNQLSSCTQINVTEEKEYSSWLIEDHEDSMKPAKK